VDKLKIDRSFVLGRGESAEDAAIVRAIIQLGHTLQLEVVAKGVEAGAQLDFLGANGCDQVQGVLVSRPLPAAKFSRRFPLGAWRPTG
jgi:EAL domain-containing protein (putative c-di-GMP-specific phosphodiesterase class I)